MAKINYTPPANVAAGQSTTLRHAFGPGLSVGVTQRAVELTVSGPGTYTRRR